MLQTSSNRLVDTLANMPLRAMQRVWPHSPNRSSFVSEKEQLQILERVLSAWGELEKQRAGNNIDAEHIPVGNQ